METAKKVMKNIWKFILIITIISSGYHAVIGLEYFLRGSHVNEFLGYLLLFGASLLEFLTGKVSGVVRRVVCFLFKDRW